MKVFIYVIGFLLSTEGALAFPLPKAGQEFSVQALAGTGNYDFEGIIKLSNCSGSLVRFEGSRDTDFAMVLTNGHCYEGGFIDKDTTIVDVSSRRSFGLMSSSSQVVGQLQATRVIYATMTGTDMTLYRLRETYEFIKTEYNIRPLTISSSPVQVSDQIEVISGYWKRGYTCAIEKIVNELQEDEWTFKDSIRYSRPGCETIGGTSGSPIIKGGTRTVIGINNTGNEDGQSCTMNNPCEIDENGNKSHQKGYSYGQQTFWVYSCLDSNNKLDLKKSGCLLPN